MKRAWEVVHLAFVGLLVGVGFFALARIWAVTALADHSDKSFWDVATTVGTCGAVLVALYVSFKDTREKTREKRELAQLTASGLTFRIGFEISAIRHALILATTGIETAVNGQLLHEVTRLVEQISICSNDELEALLPLPGGCAVSIAAARDRVEVALRFLKGESTILPSTIETRQSTFATSSRALEEAARLLEYAVEICDAAAAEFRAALAVDHAG